MCKYIYIYIFNLFIYLFIVYTSHMVLVHQWGTTLSKPAIQMCGVMIRGSLIRHTYRVPTRFSVVTVMCQWGLEHRLRLIRWETSESFQRLPVRASLRVETGWNRTPGAVGTGSADSFHHNTEQRWSPADSGNHLGNRTTAGHQLQGMNSWPEWIWISNYFVGFHIMMESWIRWLDACWAGSDL